MKVKKTNSVNIKIRSFNIVLIYAFFGGLWIIFSDKILESIISDSNMLSRFQTYKEWFFILITAILLFHLIKRQLLVNYKMKDALVTCEKQYRSLIEKTPLPIFIYRDSQFVYLNNEAWKLHGTKSESEFVGKNLLDFVHPNFKALFSKIQIEIERSDGKRDSEIKIIKSDGKEIEIAITSIPIIFENDPCRLVICNDITDSKRAERLLIEAINRYRQLFENAPVALWEEEYSGLMERIQQLKQEGMKDLRTHLDQNPDELQILAQKVQILDLNNAALAMHEAKTKEELLVSLDKTFTLQSYNVFKEEVIALAAGQTYIEHESEIKTLTGKLKYVRLHLHTRQTEESTNKQSKVLIAIIDITKQKKTEEDLRESEEKFRSISTTAKDAVIMIDNDSYITFWNESAKRIFGFTEKEALGKEIHKLIAPKKYHKKTTKRYASFKKSGGGHAIGKILELEGQRKDGTELPVELSISGFKLKGQWHAVAIIRDITLRKQNEQELINHREHLEELVKERTAELEEIAKDLDKSQQSLAYLLEDVNESRDELEAKSEELNVSLKEAEDARDKIDAILKSVADGLIVTDNSNRVILINHIAENLFKVSLKEVVNRPIDYVIEDKTLRKRVKSTLNKKIDYHFDFELPGENPDKPLIFNAHTSVIKDKEGKTNGIITTFLDVSHEREVDRMKTEFISTAAHELRTPLTSIQGFSEILLTRKNLDKRKKEKFLTFINKQAENLAAIINDLLDISRIESGKSFVLDMNPLITGQLIHEVTAPFISQSKNHYFEINIPQKQVEITIDKEKMSQVLKNLISNAIKYSPDGGAIRVSGAVKKDVYQISVEDEGVGMTPEQVSKIFDKFYRADTSNTAAEGTGLGMSIVKYIVEAHNGKVWVESNLGKGTKVTFTIPLTQIAM